MSRHEDLDQMETMIGQLKVAYEKYFQGVDKIAPQREREKLKVEMRRLKIRHGNNTERRFRLGNLEAKINSYEIHWDKTLKAIEEGTFRRERFHGTPSAANAPTSTSPPILKPSKEADTAPREFSTELHKLHESFVEARKQVGDARPVSMEALAKTVKEQAEAIKSRYKCEAVTFQVAVKDGKAILKAVPK